MAKLIVRTHLNRYRQIAEVLLHHGMGYLVNTLGLERFVPFRGELHRYERTGKRHTRPEHVRMAFEELGAATQDTLNGRSSWNDARSVIQYDRHARAIFEATCATAILIGLLVAKLGQGRR